LTLLLSNVASAGIEMSVTLSASPPNVAQGGTTTIRASITATYDGILGQQLDTGEASIVDSLAWTFGTATCLSNPADGAAETFQFNETGTFDITVSATRTVTYADETTGSATASATLQVTISATNPPHVDRVVITDDRTWSPLALEKGSGSVTLTAHACWNGPDGQPGTADDWGVPASFTWSQSPSDLGTLSSGSGSTVTFTAGSGLQNGSVTATVTGGSGIAASVPIYLYEGPRCADIDLDDENWYFGGTITLGWVKANASDDITGVSYWVTKPDNTVIPFLAYVDANGRPSKEAKVVLDQYGVWTFQCTLWGGHYPGGTRPPGLNPWAPSAPHGCPALAMGAPFFLDMLGDLGKPRFSQSPIRVRVGAYAIVTIYSFPGDVKWDDLVLTVIGGKGMTAEKDPQAVHTVRCRHWEPLSDNRAWRERHLPFSGRSGAGTPNEVRHSPKVAHGHTLQVQRQGDARNVRH
jgi:hypothetical protein